MLNNENILKGLVEFKKEFNEIEINVNDCRFRVYNQEEIDVEFYDYQVELWNEMGLESLNVTYFDYVLDNFVDKSYFEELQYDVLRENQEYYDEETIVELCEIYEEENVEKMLEMELDDRMNEVDCVEWSRDWMGDTEICRIIEEYGLIDMDNFVEWIKEVDGYGILSHYDGEVYEIVVNDENYYIIQED